MGAGSELMPQFLPKMRPMDAFLAKIEASALECLQSSCV